MGFGIFALFISVLIPLIMLGAGKWMRDYPPKDINWVFGYRTRRSMKNEDTWAFAHRHAGAMWMKVGTVMLIASLAFCFPFIGRSKDVMSIVMLILVPVQTVIIVLSVIPTERALKRTFTEDGIRKDK